MTTSAEWENPVATKEHLIPTGVSVAPNGSIIVRYFNSDGQHVILDLTAIIEEKVEAGIAAHMRTYHGHQI